MIDWSKPLVDSEGRSAKRVYLGKDDGSTFINLVVSDGTDGSELSDWFNDDGDNAEADCTIRNIAQFKVDKVGRYRTRGGGEAVIISLSAAYRHLDLWQTVEGYVTSRPISKTEYWCTNGAYRCRQDERDLVEYIGPIEESAGLSGCAIYYPETGTLAQAVSDWAKYPGYAGNGVMIDLSKVPESAIVEPEPRKETVLCRFWVFESGTIICRRKSENSWPSNVDKPIAHFETEITFTHGEGL